MQSQDQGLTVGELSVALASVLIIGLIWINFGNQSESEKQSNSQQAQVTINI